jgi:hypothetical protein
MSRPCFLLAAVALLAFSHQSHAQPSPVHSDPFARDARLERQISLRVEGLPVSELLSLLSQKTGVGLSVEQDIGDEKVVAFNGARPLRGTS